MPALHKNNPPFFPTKASPVVPHEQAPAGELLPIFVHSAVDDLGLSASEFRVYGHIARRDGPEGAWSRIADMARVCRLHPQTVRNSLQMLVSRGLLTCEVRPGRTSRYRLTRFSSWVLSKPPTNVPATFN